MEIFNAIEHSDKSLLENLIRGGIDINTSDEFGQTPLHLAIDTAFEDAIYIYDTEKKFVQPKFDIIEILLRNGANPFKEDNKGKSPINWAEERNNDKFLLELKERIKKNTPHNNSGL